MRTTWTAALGLLMVTAAHASPANIPPPITAEVDAWEKQCARDGDAPHAAGEPIASCIKMGQLAQQARDQGWCWGRPLPGRDYDFRWVKCDY